MIICIEDEADIQEDIVEVLREHGHQVVPAVNGQEGLEAIHRHRPDLVICDFLMHPAAGLPESLRRGFVRDMVGGLDDGQYLAGRVEALYPLIGLKWCMILLNEFLPENQLRLGFLGDSQVEPAGQEQGR